MKLPAVLIALLFSTFCVLAQDKNELKVKINHVFKAGTGLNSFSGKLQFNYNTSEILQITNRPENFRHGIFLRRNEVDKFKKFLDKMLKFADAVYENEITGVKKDFDDRSLWTSLSRGGYMDRGGNANTKKIKHCDSFLVQY